MITLDAWLVRHPYLGQVAELQAVVDSALTQITVPRPAIPEWERYAEDFCNGVPLLHSEQAAVELEPATHALSELVERVASCPLPGHLSHQVKVLDSELRASRKANAGELLSTSSLATSHPSLFLYLGWVTLARYLAPVVAAFARWRDEERWLRSYCPTCGAAPAMAQMVAIDPGRIRLLCCGCCSTRWRYRRTGCPFCKNEDDQKLAVLSIEGEAGLRIDHCMCCSGYLKTYDGQGSERVLLADWTSFHLDILARDRGLKRLGASLFQA